MNFIKVKSKSWLALVAPVLLAVVCAGHRRDQDIQGCQYKAGDLSDRSLAAFQVELLDLAFETATSIPVHPHIKDRSRAQQAVVETCLELEQPKRAIGFIGRIDNWRRGLCYADIAFYFARYGATGKARHYLRLAGDIAGSDIEDWRRDRIRARMAQTYARLGQMQQADEIQAALPNAESGEAAAVKAGVCAEESFDGQMTVLEGLIESGHLDAVQNALRACAKLFDRFYTDEQKRARAEEMIRTGWSAVPVFIRLELLMELAGFALDHGDRDKARELINEGQSLIDDCQWRPEHRLARIAGLIKLRARAGDMDQTRTDADAALAMFNAQRDKIVDIYRAGALRPLAEAYQHMGQTQTALAVYRQAVAEGAENPNSRPRAEDLAATCCSMALCAVEPDDKLWTRLHEISKGLGQPW